MLLTDGVLPAGGLTADQVWPVTSGSALGNMFVPSGEESRVASVEAFRRVVIGGEQPDLVGADMGLSVDEAQCRLYADHAVMQMGAMAEALFAREVVGLDGRAIHRGHSEVIAEAVWRLAAVDLAVPDE